MSSAALAHKLFDPKAWGQYLPDLRLGFQNLLLHKLRSLLTMLGMIFGVAAVVFSRVYPPKNEKSPGG